MTGLNVVVWAQTPIPVPIPEIDQVQTIPGDVVMTFSDQIPQDPVPFFAMVVSWLILISLYVCWRAIAPALCSETDEAV